jgi:hypothetical protein
LFGKGKGRGREREEDEREGGSRAKHRVLTERIDAVSRGSTLKS